jgi:hypothetical protein
MKRAHELFKDDILATGRHHFRQKGDVQTFFLAVRAVLLLLLILLLNDVERRSNFCLIFV